MSSTRQIVDTLLTIIFLVCVCLLSPNTATKWDRPSCPAQNPLIYAGRHRLHPNLVNNVTTPCGQRVFILRLPPRYSNTKSKFPFGPGKGRIWIRRGRCKETEPPQSDCPSTPDDNEGSCSAGTEKSSSATCGLTYNNTLTFRNVSSTTVEVSWSNLDIFDVSLGPVSGYAIEYREEGHQYFTRENKYENTTHIFSNLTQDTVYEFRLVLTSCGLPVDILTSEISTTRTLCGDIGPVTNLTVIDTGRNGELNVSWEKPIKESSECTVSYYQIKYRLVRYLALSENDKNAKGKPIQVNVSRELSNVTYYQKTLTGLEDYAMYVISVTIITTWSDEQSDESLFGNTIENIPSQVENFTVTYANLSVIQLTWSLPARPRGHILDYIISFEPISGANETTNETRQTVDAANFTSAYTPVHTLTGLQGETNYSIRIRARTAVGPGDWNGLTAKTTDTNNYDQTATSIEKVPKINVTTPSTPLTTSTTRPTGENEDGVTTIIVICAASAVMIIAVPSICVCLLICTKRKQKFKEKEKVPTVSGLVNGPSPYQALDERAEDITRYMKIGDFGPSTYMMYVQGNEDNQLYTGIDLSQRNSSSLDVTVPSYDASGYAGLTQKSEVKDYTQLLTKNDGSTTGGTDDENGNKTDTLKDPSGYMGLQNRPQASDYTKLSNGDSSVGNQNDILEKNDTLKDPSGYMGLQNRPQASDYTKLSNGDSSVGNQNDILEKNGGLPTFQTPSLKLNDKLTESTQHDDGNNNSVGNGLIQGSVGRSENDAKQTVRREQYERNVIPDDSLLQVPYFEHIGSEDDRISYFEPIADDEDINVNPYNASTYGKHMTKYEKSLQVPVNPFLKRKVSQESGSYETAAGSYERALDESGQPLKTSSTHRGRSSQVVKASPQNDDVSNRLSTEYFEPIEGDDDNNTTGRKEGSYARSTREFYETIPEGLRKSQKKASEGSKYGRSNYSKSIDTSQSEKSKIPARLPYEKSLLNAESPLKSLPDRKNHSSAYEDAASGYGRHITSDSRYAHNSKYFPSKTGTMKSNVSIEYFEPIADNEEYIDDPEVIRNRLENYEMIPEMRKHLRTTEKNSSKLCSTTDEISPPKDNNMTRIPGRGEKSKKKVYETSLTSTDGDEKMDPSNKPVAHLANSAANKERWLKALRKASEGYNQNSVDTTNNNEKTSGYTSGNYIEPIASKEDVTYETTQHERIDEQYSVHAGTKQSLTVDSNVSNEETYASATNDETLDTTDPEALYQAIPAYGSFQDSGTTESGVLGDIKIKNLPRQLWNGSSSPEITLTEEFQTLPRGQQHPWTAAKAIDDDVDTGILPYDHSRVKIKDLSGDLKSDYYNGSYIKDQFNKVIFIAAKVPKKATTESFWRMVWESQTEIVVILASSKSYLPSEKEAKKSVGRFTLAWSTSVEDLPEFYIRQLEIKKGNVVQIIKICQHRVWHETCRLPSPSSVITFVRQVKSVRRKESVPFIVQCSNGVGPTGVFIAVYSLLNYLKSGRGSSAGVHDFVRTMRQHRVDMVQSRSEYLLVYETLISAVLAPETAVTVDLLMRMNLIERQDALEREFETLTKLTKLSIPRSTNAGAHGTNISKNRYPEVLPLDSYRVVLKSLEKSGSGSYINATLINSANFNTTFIMAQSPLPSTNEDFWRMIYQYECSSVVSLNEMDSTNETVGAYLPKTSQKRYGKVLVKCISNPENAGGLLQQRFSLSHSSSKKKFEVNHFQLLSWPREESQMAGFIRVMMKMQPLVKTKRTVTVHCLNGASRCGVFVAIATELGNLKNRGDIDLFQTVHELKGKCRHVITKYDDYFLCYRVLKGILDARDHDYETLPSEIK